MIPSLLLDSLKDLFDVTTGYLATDLPRSIEVEYYYLQDRIEKMAGIVKQETSSSLSAAIKAELEIIRTEIVTKYEGKYLLIFNENDDEGDKEEDDDFVHDDERRQPDRTVIKLIIACKHIILVILQSSILLFFMCNINRSFF